MKKKVTLIVTCVALVAAIVVGGTLAFFTDNDKVENVVTFGNVKISLTEPSYNGDENGTITNILPGEVIAKDPTVTIQDGSSPCWVRAKVEVKWAADEDEQTPPIISDTDKAELFVIKDGWTKGEDGYYYYDTALSTDGTVKTATLFDTVTIPEDWDNDYANRNLEINVTAYATQSENNGETAQAANWGTAE